MKRYQVVYSKRGYPLVFWTNDPDNAHKFASGLRTVGYTAEVWEHTDEGARKTDL